MRYILLILVFYSDSFSQSTTKIKITVTGLRNNPGQVGIRFFNQPNGFPSERKNASKEYFLKSADNKAIFEIDNLEFGEYAIGTIHDENSNSEFDTNFLGIPKEGFGASNNPKIKMGPPSYDSAKFSFSKTDQSLEIKMNYF